ncbi:myo-inositol-1(or 4)-monophosphatase [Allopseudospirillum japonicum]|uniref:Myo-inositol-1(Or 4)-monophosphatase n=1 Tax=Allopseudospirillum japonicum TaxID=64971 RepID=A0A1H6SWM9_9GAMM|nr:inositol monophosphatase family protein [Allopseudospirillum japonicum]SEI72349.1 myo-inositol-1(or 4)-monophosphatase [Allopseudospirillum japonicum]
MQPIIQLALRAAREAVEPFLQMRERLDPTHDQASLAQVLTRISERAETLIARQLQRAYPEYGIQGHFVKHASKPEAPVWRLCAEHGMDNFAHGLNTCALSITLLKQGRAEHTVVINPITGDEYTASRGYGMQANGKRGRVPQHWTLEQARIALPLPNASWRSQYLGEYIRVLQGLGPDLGAHINSGCNLIDIAAVACGQLDAVCILGIEDEDLEPGALLLKEAGALVGNLQGAPKVETQLIAASPKAFKSLVQRLKA